MKLMHFAAATALAVAGLSSAAFAQIAPGATVYGPDGAAVGTIESAAGGNVVLNTGNMTATLPADSFGEGDNGPTIGWNKADLEAAITSANQDQDAALQAALVPGAQVYSTDNLVVGTVKEVDAANMVVVEHTTAGPIQLPKEQFAMQDSKVTFLATAGQLAAAVSAQAPAATESAAADTAADAAAPAPSGA